MTNRLYIRIFEYMDKVYQEVFRLHANFYKLLANDRRLEIIQLLENGELTVSEMSKMLGVPQPNLSQHLAILRISGVVTTKRQGLKIYYRLTSSKIAEALGLLREVFTNRAVSAGDRLSKKVLLGNPGDAFEIVTDPVCKMKINRKTAADKVLYKGKTHYFCAAGCRRRFRAHPAEFISI